MAYRIGQVARLSGVSVRTLRYYDEIGLVVPSGRTEAEYRFYTDRELERLQEVLFLRELGFALDPIRELLADPKRDRVAALRAQRVQIAAQAERATTLLALVDRTIQSIEKGSPMKPDAMFHGFDPSRHEEEARARWGHTPAYAESARRTKRYGDREWAEIHAEAQAITEAFAQAFGDGLAPADASAMDLAERHRLHVDRWFYPCEPGMHAGLGEMFVADARFAAHYEQRRSGLAAYVRDAIVANAARRLPPGEGGTADG